MKHPILRSPYRSPLVLAQYIKPWVEGKSVYELGAACGDNLHQIKTVGCAASVAGLDRNRKRVRIACSRGFDVVVADFFGPIPEHDVYYVWDRASTHYNVAEHVLGTYPRAVLIVGGDGALPDEVGICDKIAHDFGGMIIRFNYDEGEGNRQRGEFVLCLCGVK